jgi:hypothetical protein
MGQSPGRNRLRWAWMGSMVLLAVALVYVVLIGVEVFRQAGDWQVQHQERDFTWYYLSARRLLRGADLYSGLREEARAIGMEDYFIDVAVSPPTFPLAVCWLALFSYPVAWALWQVLSVVALGLSLWLIARELRPSLPLTHWLPLLCAILLFPPLAYHMVYAHTELFVLLLLTGAWVCLRRGRQVPAGILLAIAGVTRLYPLFLLLYLLQRRQWKAFVAAAGTGVGLGLAAGLAAGFDSYLRYLGVMRDTMSTYYNRAGNHSLWGVVHKLATVWPALGTQPLLRDGLALALSVSVLLLTLWLARRSGPDRAYGLFIAGALLASPLSWIYYQVLLYLPFFFLLRSLRQGRDSPGPMPARPAVLALLIAALAAAVLPVLAGALPLPAALSRAAAFLPTLTLAGTYLALALSADAAPGATRGIPCEGQRPSQGIPVHEDAAGRRHTSFPSIGSVWGANQRNASRDGPAS